MPAYTWNLCEPMYRPPTFSPANLGLDYSDGADTRWPHPGVTNGPSPTDLVANHGGTLGNTNCGVMAQRTSGGTEWFLLIGNGERYTKIQVPSGNTALSLATTQPASDFADRIHSMIVTQNPGGTPMVSFGMASGTYQNITAIAAENASDTVSANDETKAYRILARGADRIFGFPSDARTMNGNILTAAVTMDASNWEQLSETFDAYTTFTGFAMSENLALVGTSRGVLVLNAQYREFFPAFGLVPASNDNCRAMRYIPYLGVLVPLEGQLRLQNGEYSQRVGPEALGAPNDIQGIAMGIGFNADWVFLAYRNRATATTYILAARPRQPGDWHGNPISFYCIDSFSDACEWVEVLEDPDGIRTNQLLAVGKGSNIRYYRIGRTNNWTNDVDGTDNYLYAANVDQTAYGNELHFEALMDVKQVIFEGGNLASGRTLAVKVEYSSETGEEGSKTIVTENRSGAYVLDVEGMGMAIRRVHSFNPAVTVRTDSTSSAPVLKHGRVTIVAERSG